MEDSKFDKVAAARKKLEKFQQKSKKTSNKSHKKTDLTSDHVTKEELNVIMHNNTLEGNNILYDIESKCSNEAAFINKDDSLSVDTTSSYKNQHFIKTEISDNKSNDYKETIFSDAVILDLDDYEIAHDSLYYHNSNTSHNNELTTEALQDNMNQLQFDEVIETEQLELKSDVHTEHLESSENSNNAISQSDNSENVKKEETLLLTDIKTQNTLTDNNLEILTSEVTAHESSNTENIRQLSSQLQQFIEHDSSVTQVSIFELEERNRELAGLLQKKEIENQKMNSSILEYKNKIAQLEDNIKIMKDTGDTSLNQQLFTLKEQLQCYLQTIGILVGEKTELTSALEKSHALAKEKILECEELQSRLKASRHQATELKRDITALKNVTLENSKSDSYQNTELERLKLENEHLKAQQDESREEISELQQKYSIKANEYTDLQKKMHDQSSQLSLCQLKIQQLTDIENTQSEVDIENLTKEKIQLELKISELTEHLKNMNTEKEKANHQYQQYILQLRGQIQSNESQVEILMKENDVLKKREESLISHISEMEKDIQSLQNTTKRNTVNAINPSEFQKLQEDLLILQKNIEEKTKEIGELNTLNENVQNQLKGKNETITALENSLENLKADTPNVTKLMATMESDKVAAAQAIRQNNKLIQQVKELQDEYIKFSNAKVELTEKLESEQHLGKEILLQLRQCEKEVEDFKQTIDMKNFKIMDLEEKLKVSLKNDISENNNTEEVSESLENKIENVNIYTQESENEKEVYLAKVEAMKKLEERFTKTMKDVAELTEEKQRLEHLVLQLQSETETIGEYIALYQHQRGILKQKTVEKDEQLRILSKDREDLKQKLGELNYFVQDLLLNKKQPFELQSDHSADNEIINTDSLQNAEVSESNINNSAQDTIKNEIALKIIEILGKINNCNLIQPKNNIQTETFHPCPVCSGQLINI